VFLTASLLTLSVKSSSSRARFTNLFNAGVHFVRDVVVGFAVGIICGIAGLWII